MSEIKSAIELAMEKTKGLGMDKGERESFARKDVANRVRAILRRYREGMIDDDRVAGELSSIEGDEGLRVKALFDAMIEGFDLTADNEKIFALFHLTGIGLDERLGAELEALQESFTGEMEKRKVAIRERIEEKLRARGITGNGIEPNIEAWDEWKEALDEVARIFNGRLKEWKRVAGAVDSGRREE